MLLFTYSCWGTYIASLIFCLFFLTRSFWKYLCSSFDCAIITSVILVYHLSSCCSYWGNRFLPKLVSWFSSIAPSFTSSLQVTCSCSRYLQLHVHMFIILHHLEAFIKHLLPFNECAWRCFPKKFWPYFNIVSREVNTYVYNVI